LILKNGSKNINSGKPEQEFQRERLNEIHSTVTGSLIHFSLIDNFLSIFGVRRQDAAF
jgi:hypothetical protein